MAEMEEASAGTEFEFRTAPPDPRFPTQNQSRHCYARYVEYHRCVKMRGEGSEECYKYYRWYMSMCPSFWVEKWDEQREEGKFPGPI